MLVENLQNTLQQHKAEDISVYRDVHNPGEFYIVSSCTSNRHSKAVAQYIIHDLKDSLTQYHVEGLDEGNWILIEVGEALLHIFTESARSYYEVDRLWQSVKAS